MSVETKPAQEQTAPTQAGGPGTIAVQGLRRCFGETVALASLDLEIGPGGITGLLGPNGSGKSTFMRLLTGLLRPDSGSVSVDGVELVGDGVEIRRRVTYAPGELHLYGELRARDHLDWLLRGRDTETRENAARRAEHFGLPLDKRVRGYSHGMKRQLVFAAAMAPRVAVRILDEATEGLDPSKRAEVLEILTADSRQGTTILLSSHHLGEVDRACDRLVFMRAGKLLADETPASVHKRASRLMHMEWDEGTPLDGIEARLSGPAVESVKREGSRVTVLLTERDPRAFLAAFCELRDLPAPRSVQHGHISLRELYRDIYGVEGT